MAERRGVKVYGPWGDATTTSRHWIYMAEGNINKITVSATSMDICGFMFQSISSTKDRTQESFGASMGKTHTISIDFPKEYLTSISGTCEDRVTGKVVTSLCFGTNVKQHGPYGSVSGNRFSYEGGGGVIVGFHGYDNTYISAIGIYVMHKSLALGCEYRPKGHISTMIMPKDAGPWGISLGQQWDDGVFSNIRRIRVHVGAPNDVICGIQFEYTKRDGEIVISPVHGGGTAGDVIKQVELDVEKEYLTCISGFVGPVEEIGGAKAITSLTFYSNKKVYGPYGRQRSDDGLPGYIPFSSTPLPGKLKGFHGTHSKFLNSIGVHMEYF